jgi:hypothetical protein
MIPKMPAPDLIRGGNRFSGKIMLKNYFVAAFAPSSATAASTAEISAL